MSGIQRFTANATTIAIAATATVSPPAALPFSGNAVRITNEGPSVAFVAIAPTATNATVPAASPGNANSTPILPSMSVVLTISGPGPQFISTICRAAGTAALSVSIGEGI